MSDTTDTDVWRLVRDERAALVADLRTLDDAAWETPSLCEGWTVHDVAAHLVDNALCTPFGLIVDMVKARFDLDRQNERGVRAQRGATPEITLERLAAVVERQTGPPTKMAPVASRLVEEIAHGEDIRRPLGIRRDYPPEALTRAIDYQVATSDSFGGAKSLAASVSLAATDLDLQVGSGPLVSGPALELLMLVTHRPADRGRLTGPGVERLTG